MKQGSSVRRSKPLMGTMLVAAMILTACGGGEDPEPQAGDEDTGGEAAETAEPADDQECTLDPVLAEVEGLTGDERLDRLAEMAETNTVNFYGSIGEEDIVPLFEDFQERFGIEVSMYSASSEEILQRVIQEEAAGQAGADVIDNNGTELILLTREGALAQLETPFADGLRDGMVYDTWLGTRFNVFTLLRNEDRVSEEEAPRTFMDLADPRWDGQVLGGDSGNWDHFATIVQYLQDSEGMTEEEAIDLWRQITDGMVWFNSNTPVAEGTLSGELDAGITYNHYLPRYERDGETPLEWEPAIEPQVLRPNGIAVACSSANPAAGLLFLEYMVSEDGQSLLAEATGRDVAHAGVESGLLSGTDYETIVMDLEEVIDNSEKWSSLFEELVRG